MLLGCSASSIMKNLSVHCFKTFFFFFLLNGIFYVSFLFYKMFLNVKIIPNTTISNDELD